MLLQKKGISSDTAQGDYFKVLKADVIDSFLTELYGELTGSGKNQFYIQIGNM